MGFGYNNSNSGFHPGDLVLIKQECRYYYDSNGVKHPFKEYETNGDYLQKNYYKIQFKIVKVRGRVFEIWGENNYYLWIRNEMLVKGEAKEISETVKPNAFVNKTIISEHMLQLNGLKIGDIVKIKTQCTQYVDKNNKVIKIDFSENSYFKENYDRIPFKITGCRDYLPELTLDYNGHNFVIFISHEFIEPFNKPEEINKNHTMNTTIKQEYSYEDDYYNNTSNDVVVNRYDYSEYDAEGYNYSDGNDMYSIEDYDFCSQSQVNEWCKRVKYDDGKYSWTNKYAEVQEFNYDTDYINSFPSKQLFSMMYNDIYVTNKLKEKAFRRLMYRANLGNPEAQYWMGLTAFQALAGRESNKNIAFIYINLAEKNGFRVSDMYGTHLKNPTSSFIASRFNIHQCLYTENELFIEQEMVDYEDDYNDIDEYYEYEDDEISSNYNSITDGDQVYIRKGTDRYWTDIYDKYSRVNGIPNDYLSRIWTVVNSNGNKYELESTSGFLLSKKTVRIVLCLQDLSKM